MLPYTPRDAENLRSSTQVTGSDFEDLLASAASDQVRICAKPRKSGIVTGAFFRF
jgi:hypothetical protein